MNGQQQIVGLGGLALIGANFWLTDQKQTFAAGALSNSGQSGLTPKSTAQTEAAHSLVKQIAAELLFVGVATLLAGMSSQAGNAMIAVVAALAILWAIKHYSKQGSN